MEPTPAINRLGFRRWYERQLLKSFSWLATCILCGVLVMAVIELMGLSGPGVRPLITLAVVYVAGLLGINAWTRFASMLSQAQHYANRSTCERCGCYGRYRVLRENPPASVRCRTCGNEWQIESAPSSPYASTEREKR